MGNNDKVRTRTGTVKVNAANGAFTTSPSRASLAQINGAMNDEGLPPIELYDLIYRTQDGATHRFISSNVMIFVGLTGRDVQLELDNPDNTNEILPDTLGYYGLGRAAGQSAPAEVLRRQAASRDRCGLGDQRARHHRAGSDCHDQRHRLSVLFRGVGNNTGPP
jgi:hypothetical protein